MKNLNPTEFQSLLYDLGACQEAVIWAKGKSLAQTWRTCKRGDWLLWLCGKMVDKPNWPTRKQIVLAACSCAETSLKYIPSGEDRPRVAIETARKWAHGKATIEEVRQAADAVAVAYAAYAVAYAVAYAARAAYAAANAANAAAYAAPAAHAANAAAAAAAPAAAAAAPAEPGTYGQTR
jgi:hypothetical protein